MTNARLRKLHRHLKELGDVEIARHSTRFFKTGKGEYGEGDKFLGVRVPVLRKLVKTYQDWPILDVSKLLKSEFHEKRLLALLMLVALFSSATEEDQRGIYRLYLSNTENINNWDLVDSSAEHIVGAYLINRSKKPIYKLARSDNLWERRIAMMSTYHFIKKNEFKDALGIAEILKNDAEDLIHKAVGWMLREIGKRNLSVEESFLKQHYNKMPRTMLRYAIEKFPPEMRQNYLKGKV
jgi:3-methyladenine DNA glycosylase AlkD